MAVIYLDESGFTGSNLCDPEQPVFALASHCWADDEMRDVTGRFFSKFAGPDIKFSKLSKTDRGRKMVLDFLSYARERREDIRIAFAHKPFVLLCKGIDWIVQPNMERNGVNLYERGGNLAITNLIFRLTNDLAGDGYFNRLLDSLQKYFREPGAPTFTALADVLSEKTGMPHAPASGPLAEILGALYYPLLATHPDDAERIESANLEFAFTLAISVMHSWKKKVGMGMTLIHDATSAMSRQKRYWDALMSEEAPADVIGYDRRTMEFPIGISETRFEPSEDQIGIQIADVLAGAVSECMSSRLVPEEQYSPFVRGLWDCLEGWNIAHHIWPEDKFTPEELGTTGAVKSDGIAYMNRVLRQVDSDVSNGD